MRGAHAFEPRTKASIELKSQVAAEHFPRRVDRVLDLSFVRKLMLLVGYFSRLAITEHKHLFAAGFKTGGFCDKGFPSVQVQASGQMTSQRPRREGSVECIHSPISVCVKLQQIANLPECGGDDI